MDPQGPVTDWLREKWDALLALIAAIMHAVAVLGQRVEAAVLCGFRAVGEEVHAVKVWLVWSVVALVGVYLVGSWLQGRNRS